MTGLLTRVMQERADATAPDVDLDAILREGGRRVRRRRAGGLLAAAVVVGGLAAGVAGVPLLLGDDGRDLVASTGPQGFSLREVTYATGSTLHWGERTFDVGEPIASYVPTDHGFVFTTADGTVSLFDGSVSQQIGTAVGNRLRADDHGSLAAWVELADDGHPQYVVFDTAARTEVARVDDEAAGPSVEPGDAGAEVFAVDDGSVYWREAADRIVRHDVASGETTVVHDQQPPADPARKEPAVYDLADVADGQLAYVVDGGRGIETKVGPVVDVAAPTVARASSAFLSPDARFLAAEEFDNIKVYDVATRGDVTPDLARYPFAVGYGWVDADTLMALGIEDLEADEYAIDLLTCEIPAGTCELVGETTLNEQQGLFALPVGDPLDS